MNPLLPDISGMKTNLGSPSARNEQRWGVKRYREALFCIFLLLTIMAYQAFPVAYEERKPRDEKAILVPKGARPMVKEEYPRSQLVVDRIKARHGNVLTIPFSRS